MIRVVGKKWHQTKLRQSLLQHRGNLVKDNRNQGKVYRYIPINPGGMPCLAAKGLMADRVQSMRKRGLGRNVQREEEKEKKKGSSETSLSFYRRWMGGLIHRPTG